MVSSPTGEACRFLVHPPPGRLSRLAYLTPWPLLQTERGKVRQVQTHSPPGEDSMVARYYMPYCNSLSVIYVSYVPIVVNYEARRNDDKLFDSPPFRLIQNKFPNATYHPFFPSFLFKACPKSTVTMKFSFIAIRNPAPTLGCSLSWVYEKSK